MIGFYKNELLYFLQALASFDLLVTFVRVLVLVEIPSSLGLRPLIDFLTYIRVADIEA